MPAWLWITALALVAFAMFIALGRRWWRVKWLLDWLLVLSVPRWWYSWRHAAHVIEETAAEYGPGTFYGSAILSEELTWRNSSPLTIELDGVPDWLPAPTVDPEPWLAQMTAELCPHEYTPNVAGTHEWCQICDSVRAIDPPPLPPDLSGDLDAIPPNRNDPGPGDAAVIPPASSGPDQPSRWLAEQLEILRAWSERQQAYAEILA